MRIKSLLTLAVGAMAFMFTSCKEESERPGPYMEARINGAFWQGTDSASAMQVAIPNMAPIASVTGMGGWKGGSSMVVLSFHNYQGKKLYYGTDSLIDIRMGLGFSATDYYAFDDQLKGMVLVESDNGSQITGRFAATLYRYVDGVRTNDSIVIREGQFSLPWIKMP
jgi:hypothetical protein